MPQASNTTAALSITITHVLEHLYCPRVTYFEHVLVIPERQERNSPIFARILARGSVLLRSRKEPVYVF